MSCHCLPCGLGLLGQLYTVRGSASHPCMHSMMVMNISLFAACGNAGNLTALSAKYLTIPESGNGFSADVTSYKNHILNLSFPANAVFGHGTPDTCLHFVPYVDFATGDAMALVSTLARL